MSCLGVEIRLDYGVSAFVADGMPEHSIKFKVDDMNDETVHSWFELFDRVLKSAGWDDEAIALGACTLAFNEKRSVELMRKIAKASDLILGEDFHAEPVRKDNSSSHPLHDA